jgi:hypothetical protein
MGSCQLGMDLSARQPLPLIAGGYHELFSEDGDLRR